MPYIVTALLISFAYYAPSAPAGSVFARDVLVDKLQFKSRTLAHGSSRTLLGRFRLADVGADVEVTLDSGIKEEAGDSTGVPGSKRTFARLYSS
jgi:hypothetical protein